MNTEKFNKEPHQLDLFDKSQSQLDLEGFYAIEKNQKKNQQGSSILKKTTSDIVINHIPKDKLH